MSTETKAIEQPNYAVGQAALIWLPSSTADNPIGGLWIRAVRRENGWQAIGRGARVQIHGEPDNSQFANLIWDSLAFSDGETANGEANSK